MLIEYTATIRPRLDIVEHQQIVIRINGLGKDEKSAKVDAQRQARAYIKQLKYDLEVRK